MSTGKATALPRSMKDIFQETPPGPTSVPQPSPRQGGFMLTVEKLLPQEVSGFVDSHLGKFMAKMFI